MELNTQDKGSHTPLYLQWRAVNPPNSAGVLKPGDKILLKGNCPRASIEPHQLLEAIETLLKVD